jgi:hypothetical protein
VGKNLIVYFSPAEDTDKDPEANVHFAERKTIPSLDDLTIDLPFEVGDQIAVVEAESEMPHFGLEYIESHTWLVKAAPLHYKHLVDKIYKDVEMDLILRGWIAAGFPTN